MKIFKVSVDYEVCGVVDIEADTVEDAIKKAEQDDSIALPDNPEYIDGSWKVNKEMTIYFAKNNR